MGQPPASRAATVCESETDSTVRGVEDDPPVPKTNPSATPSPTNAAARNPGQRRRVGGTKTGGVTRSVGSLERTRCPTRVGEPAPSAALNDTGSWTSISPGPEGNLATSSARST